MKDLMERQNNMQRINEKLMKVVSVKSNSNNSIS